MHAQNPTVDVRKGEELDVTVIDSCLRQHIPGLSGVPLIGQYPSGASNLTYAINYPDRHLVLRRPPFGTKPKSGHSMIREYRVMTSLKPVFPAVPTTLFYTDDESILGAEFYVMERCDGHLIHASIPADWNWGRQQNAQLCHNFFTQLVKLHKVDYAAIGLADFGKPQGYVNRQIDGWNNRYERVWTDDVDRFADVRDWLDQQRPQTETGAAILHGDFRIDNCILNPQDPTEIDAILDWEISALGDPLMDLGNTLAYWIQADDPPPMQLMVKQPCTAPGMMTRQEILDFYADRTGADVSNFQFYYVYGIFRLAVIIQQIYYRFYHGQTDNPKFREYGLMTNALGNIARHKIETGKL